MAKQIKYFFILFLILYFLTTSPAIASESITTVDLTLPYKALYITSCDFNGNGKKSIVAADENNITVFQQNNNFSFKSYTIRSKDKIVALNSCKIRETNEEIIVCRSVDKLFYYSPNLVGKINEPTYINLPKDTPKFIEKQKNIKNYSFVLDLNNDALGDIAIPCENGFLVLFQTESLVFKPFFILISDSSRDTYLNIQSWPKIGENAQKIDRGLFFFPATNIRQEYWFQDYNKDGLLDIISITGNSSSYQLGVYLQKHNHEFQPPKYIKIPLVNYESNSFASLLLLDLDNDGYLDIVETNIEYPLKGNSSFLPVLVIKTFFANSLFEFNNLPSNAFKSVFIPWLNNITDLDYDNNYEIIVSPSPLKLGAKESLIKFATNREITFNFGYYHIDKSKKRYIQYSAFDKDFSITLPNFADMENFKQLIRFENITGGKFSDIILLKNSSLIELTTLKKLKNSLVIDKCVKIYLPCPAFEIQIIDIDSDGKKEFLVLDQSGRRLYTIHL